jgi:hypothetical protein
MTYQKPEVRVLESAVVAIQNASPKDNLSIFDGPPVYSTHNAYEADE